MSKESDLGDLFGDLPFQTHSPTSYAGATHLTRAQITDQECWVYETLQTGAMADWQLWRLAEQTNLFDQISSMRRARIGLVWVSKKKGATPYHPVEDSGLMIANPDTKVAGAIWRIKPNYFDLPYAKWVQNYKTLARQSR